MSFRYLTAESNLPFLDSDTGLKQPGWKSRTNLNDDQEYLDSRRSDQSKLPCVTKYYNSTDRVQQYSRSVERGYVHYGVRIKYSDERSVDYAFGMKTKVGALLSFLMPSLLSLIRPNRSAPTGYAYYVRVRTES